MTRLIDSMRIAIFWALVKLWNTGRTRWYFQRALLIAYTRRDYIAHLAGLTGRFRVTTVHEMEFLAGHHMEEEQIAALLDQVRPGDVVYEIGGHIGTWTVFLGQRVGEGHVHVFEPEPTNAKRLGENLALNRVTNVTVHQIAASDRDGTAKLAISQGDASTHSLIARDVHAGAVSVDTIRLDDAPGRLRIPPPTMVKIDVEGAEINVLQGMANLLASGGIRALFMEIHPSFVRHAGQDPAQVGRILESAGYHLARTWNRATEEQVLYLRGD